MEDREFNITDAVTGAAIAVRIVPAASTDEIAGIEEDGTVRIWLTAPPVEGQLNEALVQFLADLLSVEPSSIEVVGGMDSRKKLVTLTNASTVEVERLLRAAASRADS